MTGVCHLTYGKMATSLRIFLWYNTKNRNIFQKISFLRFTPHPLPLYGCKSQEHWAQAEGGVLLTTHSPYTQSLPEAFIG